MKQFIEDMKKFFAIVGCILGICAMAAMVAAAAVAVGRVFYEAWAFQWVRIFIYSVIGIALTGVAYALFMRFKRGNVIVGSEEDLVAKKEPTMKREWKGLTGQKKYHCIHCPDGTWHSDNMWHGTCTKCGLTRSQQMDKEPAECAIMAEDIGGQEIIVQTQAPSTGENSGHSVPDEHSGKCKICALYYWPNSSSFRCGKCADAMNRYGEVNFGKNPESWTRNAPNTRHCTFCDTYFHSTKPEVECQKCRNKHKAKTIQVKGHYFGDEKGEYDPTPTYRDLETKQCEVCCGVFRDDVGKKINVCPKCVKSIQGRRDEQAKRKRCASLGCGNRALPSSTLCKMHNKTNLNNRTCRYGACERDVVGSSLYCASHNGN